MKAFKITTADGETIIINLDKVIKIFKTECTVTMDDFKFNKYTPCVRIKLSGGKGGDYKIDTLESFDDLYERVLAREGIYEDD